MGMSKFDGDTVQRYPTIYKRPPKNEGDGKIKIRSGVISKSRTPRYRMETQLTSNDATLMTVTELKSPLFKDAELVKLVWGMRRLKR
jgi:hypothetical protein